MLGPRTLDNLTLWLVRVMELPSLKSSLEVIYGVEPMIYTALNRCELRVQASICAHNIHMHYLR